MSDLEKKAELYEVLPGNIIVWFEPPVEKIGLVDLPDSAKGYRNEAIVLKIGEARIDYDHNGNKIVTEPPPGLKVGDRIPLKENWCRDRRIEISNKFRGDDCDDYLWFISFKEVYAIKRAA